MIRTRSKVGDTVRLIAPGMDAIRTLPVGTVVVISAHAAEQPNQLLALVDWVPEYPEIVVTVPKGAKVKIVEE